MFISGRVILLLLIRITVIILLIFILTLSVLLTVRYLINTGRQMGYFPEHLSS